jgi:hypothetical protein
MKNLIYLMATAALVVGIAATEIEPAQATIGVPGLKPFSGQSIVTPAHCRAFRHCHRRCHRGRCWRWCHRC